jgi:hypothetical protein
MRHKTVTVPVPGIDWKGLGYTASIISVFLLGAVAWPSTQDPAWQLPVLLGGMATSILGMGFRYLEHLKQLKELRRLHREQVEARRG